MNFLPMLFVIFTALIAVWSTHGSEWAHISSRVIWPLSLCHMSLRWLKVRHARCSLQTGVQVGGQSPQVNKRLSYNRPVNRRSTFVRLRNDIAWIPHHTKQCGYPRQLNTSVDLFSTHTSHETKLLPAVQSKYLNTILLPLVRMAH